MYKEMEYCDIANLLLYSSNNLTNSKKRDIIITIYSI